MRSVCMAAVPGLIDRPSLWPLRPPRSPAPLPSPGAPTLLPSLAAVRVMARGGPTLAATALRVATIPYVARPAHAHARLALPRSVFFSPAKAPPLPHPVPPSPPRPRPSLRIKSYFPSAPDEVFPARCCYARNFLWKRSL
jgi:hypothetical protein